MNGRTNAIEFQIWFNSKIRTDRSNCYPFTCTHQFTAVARVKMSWVHWIYVEWLFLIALYFAIRSCRWISIESFSLMESPLLSAVILWVRLINRRNKVQRLMRVMRIGWTEWESVVLCMEKGYSLSTLAQSLKMYLTDTEPANTDSQFICTKLAWNQSIARTQWPWIKRISSANFQRFGI